MFTLQKHVYDVIKVNSVLKSIKVKKKSIFAGQYGHIGTYFTIYFL